MNRTSQHPFKRMAMLLMAIMLLVGSMIPNMGLVTPSKATILPVKRTYIQMTVDPSSWELMAGVVTSESAAITGKQLESSRIGKSLLNTLAGTDTPSAAADSIPVGTIPSISGDSTAENLVLCFPGVMSISGWDDNSTSADTSRAQLVRNSLIYDLNTAFKWVYGDQYGNYKPAGADFDAQMQQYAQDMKSFMSSIPSGTITRPTGTFTITGASADDFPNITAEEPHRGMPDEVTEPSDYVKITNSDGEFRIFQYRMLKGYVEGSDKLGLSSVSVGRDTKYVHWGQFAVEAFYNYGADEKVRVTPDGVYDGVVGALEKAIADFFGGIANWIANALGLWNFDELIFNSGLRGTLNYVGGVFPTNWQPTIWAFFFISEVAALAILLFAIIYNVGRKVMSTIDPVARASAIEQIKYLFIVAFILGILPFALPLLINTSAELTGIFHDALGANTATERFKSLASNSGGLGSVLTYLIYLCALVYFNVFFVFRALTIALLFALGPIFVSLMALSETKRYLTVMWFKEFCANLFVQPLQAIMLSFILLVPPTGRNIESIIMAYIMIPLTNMIRQLFFGSSGSMADMIGQKGKQEGKRVGSLAVGAAAGAVHGGFTASMAARNSNKANENGESESAQSGGESSGKEEQQPNSVTKATLSEAAKGGLAGGTDAASKNGGSEDTSPGSVGGAGGAGNPALDGDQGGAGASGGRVEPGTTSAASHISDQARLSMAAGAQGGSASGGDQVDGNSDVPAIGGPEVKTMDPDNPVGSGDSLDANAGKADAVKKSNKLGGVAMIAGAAAVGMAGGAMDYVNKRVFGLMPGRSGGMVTQLSRKMGAAGGNLYRTGSTQAPNNRNAESGGSQDEQLNVPNFNPAGDEINGTQDTQSDFNPMETRFDGGYADAMEHEASYNDPESSNPYVRGIANRQGAQSGPATYTMDSESMKDAGIRNIHKAGQNQTAVNYSMDNLGTADQNRLTQMINMWENGSTQEKMMMEASGIADIQPVTKMVNGQATTVGASVTYNDQAVQQNYGINTRPVSTGGKGIEVTTSSDQAPAFVPDVASFMNSTQAQVPAAEVKVNEIPKVNATVRANNSGGVDITCQDASEFSTIEALAEVPITLEPRVTGNGYTATVPQETFSEAFPVPSAPATQAVREVAVEYVAPPVPPAPAPTPPRSSGGSRGGGGRQYGLRPAPQPSTGPYLDPRADPTPAPVGPNRNFQTPRPVPNTPPNSNPQPNPGTRKGNRGRGGSSGGQGGRMPT